MIGKFQPIAKLALYIMIYNLYSVLKLLSLNQTKYLLIDFGSTLRINSAHLQYARGWAMLCDCNFDPGRVRGPNERLQPHYHWSIEQFAPASENGREAADMGEGAVLERGEGSP